MVVIDDIQERAVPQFIFIFPLLIQRFVVLLAAGRLVWRAPRPGLRFLRSLRPPGFASDQWSLVGGSLFFHFPSCCPCSRAIGCPRSVGLCTHIPSRSEHANPSFFSRNFYNPQAPRGIFPERMDSLLQRWDGVDGTTVYSCASIRSTCAQKIPRIEEKKTRVFSPAWPGGSV